MLAAAMQNGVVNLWDDEKIVPGENWKAQDSKNAGFGESRGTAGQPEFPGVSLHHERRAAATSEGCERSGRQNLLDLSEFVPV